tara:strand:- start:231 stop:371 length:141 start_codon:yes stop_codon:yes gene_type:complete
MEGCLVNVDMQVDQAVVIPPAASKRVTGWALRVCHIGAFNVFAPCS